MSPFSDVLEPFSLLTFNKAGLTRKRRCLRCSSLIRFHFLCSDISIALFFGAKSVAVVVAFLDEFVFDVSIRSDPISDVFIDAEHPWLKIYSFCDE